MTQKKRIVCDVILTSLFLGWLLACVFAIIHHCNYVHEKESVSNVESITSLWDKPDSSNIRTGQTTTYLGVTPAVGYDLIWPVSTSQPAYPVGVVERIRLEDPKPIPIPGLEPGLWLYPSGNFALIHGGQIILKEDIDEGVFVVVMGPRAYEIVKKLSEKK